MLLSACSHGALETRNDPQFYDNKAAAESSELALKDCGQQELTSLGGEFFRSDWMKPQSIFVSVPGVSRFGGK
ncbi:UNVERIFIED_ORG: hypothetical protein BCL66_110137 [Martelella mediterranea]